ncbi:MAG: ABC transporter permease [Rhodocyclaceae bacterium]|nr:ABC transporter permease [Rhodocyclaceae bacterium]
MVSFTPERLTIFAGSFASMLNPRSRAHPSRRAPVHFMISSLIASIYRYRGFVIGSVKREFASRYRNSMLGAAWLVLQPLAQILVFTLIFSQVMQARLPGLSGTFAYSIFLCAGTLTWGLFAEIVGRAQTVFLDNANLLKKLSFPRICLPIIVVLSAFLNFVIIFGLFTAFLVFSGNFPGWPYLALFPVLLLQMTFAIGLGMVLGVLNVFFRDVGQFFGIVLQFWFWLTPIVYPMETLPVWARGLLAYNPMTPLVTAYQGILLKGSPPVWSTLGLTAGLAMLLCTLGLALFRRHAGEMVDEL